MDELQKKIIPIAIEDEMKESYLTYAMSVIVSRALPDVRDGLKPVHRRILYSMHQMGLRSDRAFKKCGRIVGDVLGKYHPHGDAAIYDSLVRLAQNFSMRYPVVNPQGNFGSIDGDPPAAMRYTEAKMNRIAEEMLRDIDKETVDFAANYDESMKEPLVLPGAFPYLLVNGGSGIAVGMATNMPPNNLEEITQAAAAYIDNPDISPDDLCTIVKGPDFPTGGIIFGTRGIRRAYKTGRGKITVRARCSLETDQKGKDYVLITELPYLVNKSVLIARIADLVRSKKIDGISDLRDESDRDGMRIVIELKRGAVARVVLNQLFTNTSLQQNFSVNALALVDGKPQLLSLKDMISCFVAHRRDVITRRTRYELRKAEERAHILQGLKIALDNIDEVVEMIKKSPDAQEAKARLIARFSLTDVQAQAILDMRLQRLTSLETRKISEELDELIVKIAYFKKLLAHERMVLDVVKEELIKTGEAFSDPRRTEIQLDEVEEINIEDLITKEDMVVVISNRGFIKRVPASAYRSQGRGGRGSASAKLREEDLINHIFVASTHDHIMFVTSEGKAYWLKVHEIPEGSRAAKGSHIKALMNISPDEDVSAVVSIKDFTAPDQYLFMVTTRGIVKKVQVSQFVNAKRRGIVAIKLDNGDRLVSAQLTDGTGEALIISRKGLALRFPQNSVRSMGRATRGVTGMRLRLDDEIAAILFVDTSMTILVVTEKGYGKRMSFENFTPHSRATRGQICYKIQEKTGEIVSALRVREDDQFMTISSMGNTLRLEASSISMQGRQASGIILAAIAPPDHVKAITLIKGEKDEQDLEEAVRERKASSGEPIEGDNEDSTIDEDLSRLLSDAEDEE